MAGPIPDGDPIRGIIICRNVSEACLRQRFADDHHVRSGRLLLELYPWLVPGEMLERPLLPSNATPDIRKPGGPTKRPST
ncbi:MAG: hypothetical protein WBR18_15875 [Anaerolineales bacterium]